MITPRRSHAACLDGITSTAMNLIRRFRRLVFGMSSSPYVFPFRSGDSVSALTLTENPLSEGLLQSFLLTNSDLCRDNIGIEHELTVYRFKAPDDEPYYIAADRTQPLSANIDDTRPTLSRHSSGGDVFNQISTSFSKKDASDRVRRFTPTGLFTNWWEVVIPRGKRITQLEVTRGGSPCLDLLQVAYVLRSVSEYSQHKYVLARENCWWYARCVGLLLEILAAQPATSNKRTTLEKSFFSRVPLRLPIPIPSGLSNDMIREDVGKIEEHYNRLVRLSSSSRLIGLLKCNLPIVLSGSYSDS